MVYIQWSSGFVVYLEQCLLTNVLHLETPHNLQNGVPYISWPTCFIGYFDLNFRVLFYIFIICVKDLLHT